VERCENMESSTALPNSWFEPFLAAPIILLTAMNAGRNYLVVRVLRWTFTFLLLKPRYFWIDIQGMSPISSRNNVSAEIEKNEENDQQ